MCSLTQLWEPFHNVYINQVIMFTLSIYYHLLYLNYTSIKLKKMWEFVWGSCLIKAPAWEKN